MRPPVARFVLVLLVPALLTSFPSIRNEASLSWGLTRLFCLHVYGWFVGGGVRPDLYHGLLNGAEHGAAVPPFIERGIVFKHLA